MQTVNLIRIFIASPSDVAEERDAACRVTQEWNAAHSLARSMIIEPVRVETHVQAAQGGHPQDLINAQLLERCDFLVAIFWSRIGSPTKSDPSGTIQELREFGETKGHERILLFFSTCALPHDLDTAQLSALREFKKSVQDKGVYIEYDSPNGFSSLFRQQLDLALNSIAETMSPVVTSNEERELLVFSPEANTLLAAAVLDERGIVSVSRTRSGHEVIIKRVCYSRGNDPRSESRWEDGIIQLERVGFIVDLGNKREVFRLTKKGFEGTDQTWYVLLLRVLAEMQSSEYDIINLTDIAKRKFFGQSIPLSFVQEKVAELETLGCVHGVNVDVGLIGAKLTYAGRKAIREHSSMEFAEVDTPLV